MISLKATRKYPSLPSVGQTADSHVRVLEALSECVATHERRTGDVMSSFVRVKELIDLGIARVEGRTVVLAIAAKNISYDNTTSGLTATNLQEAIDELAGLV